MFPPPEKKASGPAGPPATTPEQSIDHEASTTADTDGVSAITDPKGVTTDENPAVYNNTASGDDTVPEEGVEGVAPSLNETSIPPISADKVSKIPEEYPALDNKSGSSALPQVDEASLSKDNDHDTQADKHKHENSNAASPIDELAGEDI